MARLRRLLPAWETCSPRIDEPAACDGSEPGVGGQLGAGAWRSLPGVWASKDGGGRDP